MYKEVRELFQLLSSGQRRRFYWLQLFVVSSALMEVVGIASIAPFMALVSDVTLVETNVVLKEFYAYTGLTDVRQFIVLIGVIVLACLALSAAMSVGTVARLSSYATSVGSEISYRLFSNYMSRGWLFFTQASSPELTKKIAQESQRLTSQVLLPLVHLNAKLVSIIAILIALILYNPVVALVGLAVFGVIYVFLFRVVRSALQDNSANISVMLGLRFRLMNDAFGGAKDILLMGREDNYLQQFRESGNTLATALSRNMVLGQVPRYVIEFVAFGAVISLVIYLFATHDKNLTSILPELSLYALAALKLLPAFQSVYSSLTQIKGNIHAYLSLREDLIASKPELRNSHCPKQGQECDAAFDSALNLNNVCFKYPGRRAHVLRDASLTIKANTTVGFAGPSGAGKSTLVDIIMGLLKPSSGTLSFDNGEIGSVDDFRWQKMIGYVPQKIFLSQGTIAENVAFGLNDDQIDYVKVDAALDAAYMSAIVQDLPQGTLTPVGDQGVQLSGGQRQRLAIARALYHNPSVLVFDEATSALDGITERIIMDAIARFKGKKTILVIAHRLKTIEDCDQIVFLEHGQVTHTGTFSDLLHKSDKFRDMAEHS